ncbi:AsnC family protein [Actinokineospora globicatena]|uniref:Uncharacterized protein n=1 Tax=Actinokineospora globicatena TaxID=103729 RepID=A0A9W6QKP8_9PSEU|nr:AsnC family protein [Actinokineospora globicatena]GLW91811.1 hypothetical protein Aglo03_26270 [Actinokineospora globicatena]
MSDPSHARIKADTDNCPTIPRDPKAIGGLISTMQMDALDLIVDIREYDPAMLWGRLNRWRTEDPLRLIACTVALAAMCNPDAPARDALAWLDSAQPGADHLRALTPGTPPRNKKRPSDWSNRPITAQQTTLLHQLIDEGRLTYRTIAERVGCSDKTVRRHALARQAAA